MRGDEYHSFPTSARVFHGAHSGKLKIYAENILSPLHPNHQQVDSKSGVTTASTVVLFFPNLNGSGLKMFNVSR